MLLGAEAPPMRAWRAAEASRERLHIFCHPRGGDFFDHAGAPGAGADFHGHRGGPGDSIGNFYRAAAGAAYRSAGYSQRVPDDSEFGPFWFSNSHSVYWRNWEADGGGGAGVVCAAADSAEYVCGADGDRSGGSGGGHGDGHDAVAGDVARAAAAGAFGDLGGDSHGDRDYHWGGDDCGGDWRGRVGDVYFSRGGHGERCGNSGGGDSGGVVGIAGRWFVGDARTAVAGFVRGFVRKKTKARWSFDFGRPGKLGRSMLRHYNVVLRPYGGVGGCCAWCCAWSHVLFPPVRPPSRRLPWGRSFLRSRWCWANCWRSISRRGLGST